MNLKNLLIVEDNTLIKNNLVDAINETINKISIHLTDSLNEAFNLLSVKNFNLIILDLSLPDGSGLELLKNLNAKKSETRILVFSTNTHLKRVCLKYGAFAFYDKAHDFDNLIEFITNEN